MPPSFKNLLRTADRPVIMGILNVTPNSFSDGGLYLNEDSAVAGALQMLHEGADIIDVGGESTRPGSQPVPQEEQIRRVLGVIRKISGAIAQRDSQKRVNTENEPPSPAASQSFPLISVDTSLPAVAQAAIEAGASIINDVSAGRHPGMLDLAASHQVPLVLMHMQGTPATMQLNPHYSDVVAQVLDFLTQRVRAAIEAGISPEQIVIDPGIGFGKTTQHNLTLLAHLDRLVATGYPVLLGTSRKRFLGQLTPQSPGSAAAPLELVAATCATTALGVSAGVSIFRVHDVAPNRQAADVAWAVQKVRAASIHV